MPQAMLEPEAGGPPPRRRRLWGWLRVTLLLAVGIGVGAGITAGLPGKVLDAVDASSDTVVPTATPRIREAPATPARTPDGRLRRPDDPATAVRGFLAAESERRFADAFAFLSTADHDEFGDAAGYVAAHADWLPPLRDFTVDRVEERGGSAVVVTRVAFEASLDEVAGLVPGAAEVTWTAVASDGGWAVELTSAAMVPQYPAEEQAVQDVAAWAAARRACRAPPPALEHTPVRGVASLADALCGADVEVAVGGVGPLREVDAASFLAAYGGEVSTWARVVDVDTPVGLRAVVAPIGDRWAVIGVLPPGRGP